MVAHFSLLSFENNITISDVINELTKNNDYYTSGYIIDSKLEYINPIMPSANQESCKVYCGHGYIIANNITL